MLKDFQVDLELSPKHNGLINTRARFYSHDVNTAKLYVRLNKNGELINLSKEATVRIVMLMTINNENKKHVYEMNYEELGLVSILLPKQILGYQGQVTAGVYVDYGEGQSTDNGYFIFNMERSLIDEDFPELDTVYVSEFEKALEEMNETLHEFDDFETDVNERLANITTNIDETETNVLTKLDELDKKIDDKDVAKQSDIDDIVNGELNLLRGTKRFSTPWRLVRGVPVKDSDGLYYFSLKNTYTEWAYIPYDEWEKGEEYILSFHARSEKDVAFNPKIEIPGSPSWAIPITSREFKRYEVKFVVDFDNKNGTLQLLTRQNTAYVDIKKVKLEKANKSIGWQPHSSEMVDNIDIESLQKQIDELKNAILNQGGTM